MENKEIRKRPFFVKCAIIEATAVGIVVLSVLIITLISKPVKAKIRKFYGEYVLQKTSANEVLKGKDSYEV